MPIFEYACEACHHQFEQLTLSGQKASACPQCGGAELRRRYSSFSFSGGRSEPSFEGGCGRCGADTPGSCQMN